VLPVSIEQRRGLVERYQQTLVPYLKLRGVHAYRFPGAGAAGQELCRDRTSSAQHASSALTADGAFSAVAANRTVNQTR
jgi:hypothetical protein